MNLDNLIESLGSLISKTKDLETDKIAAIGLILLGTVALVGKIASHGSSTILENAKDITDIIK